MCRNISIQKIRCQSKPGTISFINLGWNKLLVKGPFAEVDPKDFSANWIWDSIHKY
jgi:hypothetical protein